ncbi:uncharacterized protein LOC144618483 [Crassostrea virginica]
MLQQYLISIGARLRSRSPTISVKAETAECLVEIVLFSVWYIQSSKTDATAFKCERERNGGCCDGYFRIPGSEKCIECSPGYSGTNCSIQCPYPTYGYGCQGICDCDKDICDISTGCTLLTTEIPKRCLPGYVGRNCRARCIYPFYGEECESQCNCSEHLCDVIVGCRAYTEGTFLSIIINQDYYRQKFYRNIFE